MSHWWLENTNISGYPTTRPMNPTPIPQIINKRPVRRIIQEDNIEPKLRDSLDETPECLFINKYPKLKNQSYQLQLSISKKEIKHNKYILTVNEKIPIQLKILGKNKNQIMILPKKNVVDLWNRNLSYSFSTKPPKGFFILDTCSMKQVGVKAISMSDLGKLEIIVEPDISVEIPDKLLGSWSQNIKCATIILNLQCPAA